MMGSGKRGVEQWATTFAMAGNVRNDGVWATRKTARGLRTSAGASCAEPADASGDRAV